MNADRIEHATASVSGRIPWLVLAIEIETMTLRALIVVGILLIVMMAAHRLTRVAVRPKAVPMISAKAVDSEPQGTHTLVAPLRGEPLIASAPILTMQSRMGDREAADRLFAESRQCLKFRLLDSFFGKVGYAKWLANNEAYLASVDQAERERITTAIATNLDFIESSRDLCAGIGADFNDGRIYNTALIAARLGNDDATACLLASPYDLPKRTPAEAREFDREAMALGQASLQRGSWKTVLAMAQIYSYNGIEGQTGPVSHLSEVNFLKMIRLERRGVPDGTADAAQLDRMIAAVEPTVPRNDSAATERWADDMFLRFFRSSGPPPPLTSVACDH